MYREKVAIYKKGAGPYLEPHHASTLSWTSSIQSCEHKLLFKPPSLHYSVTGAQAVQDNPFLRAPRRKENPILTCKVLASFDLNLTSSRLGTSFAPRNSMYVIRASSTFSLHLLKLIFFILSSSFFCKLNRPSSSSVRPGFQMLHHHSQPVPHRQC